MNLVHKLCLSAIALLWLGQSIAIGQIVNIESKRIATDSAGWFGSARVSFAGSKTTKETFAFSANTRIEYKSKSSKDLWLLLSDLSLVTGDKEKFSNAGFGHLRYNRKLGGTVRWEAFTQIQYNSLTKVDKRVLFGTGPRFKLTKLDKARFYFGIAYMYEEEYLIEPILVHKDSRISSYLSFTLLPEDEVTFINTTYIQPLIEDVSDYRISNESSLNLAITKKLVLGMTLRYGFDARPPEGVPKSIYAFANYIEVQF